MSGDEIKQERHKARQQKSKSKWMPKLPPLKKKRVAADYYWQW